MTSPDAPTFGHGAGEVLFGQRVTFVGRLGGLTRREAEHFVIEQGGKIVDLGSSPDLVVIGADEVALDYDGLLPEPVRLAIAESRTECLTETQLWERLGWVDEQRQIRRLYTPAMLAELLHVPLPIIRRWHRRGLILPAREVQRLPYFDFQEVATARKLAELLVAGVSPQSIERKLSQLARWVPDVERPLAQLSVIVEGRQLLLRQGEGLIEPGGQMRLDFDAAERRILEEEDGATVAIDFGGPSAGQEHASAEDLVWQANHWEDRGELALAAEAYRAALIAGGPRPEICFSLAEVLYRLNDLTAARERYLIAIELDPTYVEARANLGCVLAELGQLELAVAAFDGALQCHHGYSDVHYHLARTLDELNDRQRAAEHWQTFLELAPNSPWAEEAIARLEIQDSVR